MGKINLAASCNPGSSAMLLKKRPVAAAATTRTRATRTCSNPQCSKNPYFGWHGGKAVFCVTHKETGMVDVKNKRCEEDMCMKRGLFGYEGEKARFCSRHRLEGMVDLKNKRCKWVGCTQQANFAQVGKVTAIFCLEHRSPGMVDVKGPRCSAEFCAKVAGYGVQGHRPSACLLHRAAGMVEMKQHRVPRRPRRLPTNKSDEPRGLDDVNLGVGVGGGGTTRLSSRGTGVNMPGARDLFDNDQSAPDFVPPTSGLDPCSKLDSIPRPASACDISSGRDTSCLPEQRRFLKPSNTSNQPDINTNNGGQGLRSWVLGAGVSKAATGTTTSSISSSIPTVNIWAFDGKAGDSGSGNNNEIKNGGPQQQQQQLSFPSSHWASDRTPNHYSTSTPYHLLSELTTTTVRGSTSLPALNRFVGGGGGDSVGGDGLFSDGERVDMDAGEWHSADFGEKLQQLLSEVSAAMDQRQPGYVEPSSLRDGDGRGSVESGAQETMASGGLDIPEVESVDTWLRALMQETNAREGSNTASQQQHEAQSNTRGGMVRYDSHQNTRRFSNPQFMNLSPTITAPPTTGGSYHSVQQHHNHHHERQRQQSNSLGSMQPLGSVRRTEGGSTGAARISSTIYFSAVAARGRSPSMVSMESCSASPPKVPGTPSDILAPPPLQGFHHNGDLARGESGGGCPGVASGVPSALRAAKTRGAAPVGSGPPPYDILTSGALPAMVTGGGRGRRDRSGVHGHGHGSGGFTQTDMHFSPLKSVVAPPAWGGSRF
ncbi:unnamed protein product [Pylaiella littoralis]